MKTLRENYDDSSEDSNLNKPIKLSLKCWKFKAIYPNKFPNPFNNEFINPIENYNVNSNPTRSSVLPILTKAKIHSQKQEFRKTLNIENEMRKTTKTYPTWKEFSKENNVARFKSFSVKGSQKDLCHDLRNATAACEIFTSIVKRFAVRFNYKQIPTDKSVIKEYYSKEGNNNCDIYKKDTPQLNENALTYRQYKKKNQSIINKNNRIMNIYEKFLMRAGKEKARELYSIYFGSSYSPKKLTALENAINNKKNLEKNSKINEHMIWSQNGKYSYNNFSKKNEKFVKMLSNPKIKI